MNGAALVVGAGQAGAQAALSLRQEGYTGDITLIGAESELPYQRPPLSKAYLTGQAEEVALRFRQRDAFDHQRIRLMLSSRVVGIDRESRRVFIDGADPLMYEHLVLATGVSSRELAVPGVELRGVHYLRTVEDARLLRSRLLDAKDVVVIGGGFIGMEFASVARKKGLGVHVVEVAGRLMGRAVSETVSSFFHQLHAGNGVRISLGTEVKRLVGLKGHISGVELPGGEVLPADLVLIGIGVVPNVDLARQAGLQVANGIVVDNCLRTQDPRIWAVGDCAAYPSKFSEGFVRLESVQNAADHARCVAANIAKGPAEYRAVPWFWSEQYDVKLQMVGLTAGADGTVVRGDVASKAFSVFAYRDGKFVGLESVNRPSDHMAARRILEKGGELKAELLGEADFDLKAYGNSLA